MDDTSPIPTTAPDGPPEAAPGAAAPPTPKPRLHPVWRVLLYLVACLVLQIVPTFVALVAGRLLGFESLSLEGLTSGRIEGTLFVAAVAAPLLVPLTAAFTCGLDRRPLSSIGARWPAGGPRAALRNGAWAVLGTLAFLGLWIAIVAAMATVRVHGLAAEVVTGPGWWPGVPAWLPLVLFFAGFLLQSSGEEWMLRGYAFHVLAERWRWWIAALASASIFAVLHAGNPDASWPALVNTALIGFLYAEVVRRTGSLLEVALSHGVWNFTLGCIASLPVSGTRAFNLLDVSVAGPELLTGGAYGPEGSLLLTAMLVPLLLGFWRAS